ncbi:MAG TPA: pyruvate kinase [Firmicutes bacterium]|nr:pyruvate kinase [Bacillota bacterium]
MSVRRRTKIVATLGPASSEREVLRGMVRAGLDVARFNLSHGDASEHEARLHILREICRQEKATVGVLADLRGPEVRIGRIAEGGVCLEKGECFTLTTRPVMGDAEQVSVLYPDFPRDVSPGQVLLLDDGNIALVIEEVTSEEVRCRVKEGGFLPPGKKVVVPGGLLRLPSLSDADRASIAWGVKNGVDFFACSFVRKAADVIEVRRAVEECGGEQEIIAKIETRQAVEDLDAILRVADGLMVARGDLGVEMPAEEVPLVQKEMIARCNSLGKPVITATQMLESMVERPVPTRAEASDVANAILDGTDAVMLSAETALGKYPVAAVTFMARIAARTEQALPYDHLLAARERGPLEAVTDAISHASCRAARDLGAAAIITPTQSGYTARMVAKYRPACPILALTPHEVVRRRLALVWGVRPLPASHTSDAEEMFSEAIATSLAAGEISQGDLVVITAGIPSGVPGTTNLLRVHTVGEILVQGRGIAPGAEAAAASGPVCAGHSLSEIRQKFRPGDVLVVSATDADFVPLLRQASGLVVEEGGLSSHAAICALELSLPAVVGAERAVDRLSRESSVTVDARRGLVYRGRARVL